MKSEVKEVLKSKTIEMMHNYTMNWYNMQKPDALKNINCPVGYGTLRRIVKDDTYYSMTPSKQSKLLKYYKVKHKFQFGNIELLENGDDNNN